ncbi:uncharacterized protein PHALS_03122 [Plasmopara halstedii]|uniref:Uncharacterized protein n=1 Tax=Plasmopara halstedii TaxID=4781 RepID=A0A0P1A8I8_PLAHL|nr:uncharacterized protein PHALS_03122 [Plasmopara halstedii]CEG36575.1 hypothetical protein PHALS_03122 [Plasmopara halstedii]|eukprot:XP_024572944.1 hypothetical protein PHALS_03122 [Plasmopara halstedii]
MLRHCPISGNSKEQSSVNIQCILRVDKEEVDPEEPGLVETGDDLVTFLIQEMARTSAEMPAMLTSRRVDVSKETLGEHTNMHIARHLGL